MYSYKCLSVTILQFFGFFFVKLNQKLVAIWKPMYRGNSNWNIFNKRPINLNAHLSTIANTQTSRGVSHTCMHFIRFHSGVEKLKYCYDDHAPAWYLSKMTLKDHYRLHDLILERYKTPIENNFALFVDLRDRFYL